MRRAREVTQRLTARRAYLSDGSCEAVRRRRGGGGGGGTGGRGRERVRRKSGGDKQGEPGSECALSGAAPTRANEPRGRGGTTL
jgi:hypothetical protein